MDVLLDSLPMSLVKSILFDYIRPEGLSKLEFFRFLCGSKDIRRSWCTSVEAEDSTRLIMSNDTYFFISTKGTRYRHSFKKDAIIPLSARRLQDTKVLFISNAAKGSRLPDNMRPKRVFLYKSPKFSRINHPGVTYLDVPDKFKAFIHLYPRTSTHHRSDGGVSTRYYVGRPSDIITHFRIGVAMKDFHEVPKIFMGYVDTWNTSETPYFLEQRGSIVWALGHTGTRQVFMIQ